MSASRSVTHSILVRGFTCPSSHLIAFFVSMSQIKADPWCCAVAINLPEGSKRANIAFAERDVCTAVGYCIIRGSVCKFERNPCPVAAGGLTGYRRVGHFVWLDVRRARRLVVGRQRVTAKRNSEVPINGSISNSTARSVYV